MLKANASRISFTIARFKRNKLAMAGLFFIFIIVLISLLGAFIRPDNSYKANTQTLEIAIKKPGFSQKFLKIDSSNEYSFFEKLKSIFIGFENGDRYIPINNYKIEGEKVIIEKYIDGFSEGQTQSFEISEVINFRSKPFLNDFDPKNYLAKNNIVEKYYLLGTDRFGRDVLSRLMAGAWVSLSVGFISVLVSLIIGLLFGSMAGFFGGWVDVVISWFINVVWSIPTLLLIIVITIALGKNFWQIFFAVGFTMWVEIARVVRGQVISIRQLEYIEATRSLGYSTFRVIIRHIIPNVMGSVVVISAINFASAILIEAGLSYLGIGVQAPQSSWGKMISDHKGYIITGNAYLAIIPGLIIVAMVLSFVFIGNGIRDAIDPKGLNTANKRK